VARTPLDRFLEHEAKLLSARATEGFLKRTRLGRLRFPDGFIQALEAHLTSVRQIEANDNGLSSKQQRAPSGKRRGARRKTDSARH
jgi:DNA (cytosine-5)-methyltransferase 1